MSSWHRRALRLLVSVFAATALAAPTTTVAAAGGSPGVRSSPTVESPAPVVVRVDDGFDWVAAGVGAVGGIGLALALTGIASAVRRRPNGNGARA